MCYHVIYKVRFRFIAKKTQRYLITLGHMTLVISKTTGFQKELHGVDVEN